MSGGIDGRQLDRLLGGLGEVSVEPAPDPGATRVSLRRVDVAHVRFARTELLTAWIRRKTDEREVACAMTRMVVERQRKQVRATRTWADRVLRRLASST